jgi:hypothetical protein
VADPVVIDCDSCEVRGLACGDCVVTVLLGAPPQGVVLDADERRALEVLAGSGLVPPLRLVQADGPVPSAEAGDRSENRRQHDATRFAG